MPVENRNSDPDFVDDAAIEANIRKVVQTLMLIENMTVDELAPQLNIKRSALYNRLAKDHSTRFSVAEVYRMSRIFGVSVSTFYAPPELATIGYKSKPPVERPFSGLESPLFVQPSFVFGRHLASVKSP